MSEPTKAEIVAAVRKHAEANYERGGWDVLVECYSDEDILEELGRCRTVGGAIRKIGYFLGVRRRYSDDIRNS